MTVKELSDLGNGQPVMYRGERVTFENLTMRLAFGSARRHPMKARIRLRAGRRIEVFPSSLSPVSETVGAA